MTKTLKKIAIPKNRVAHFAESNGKPEKKSKAVIMDVIAPLSSDIFSGFIGGRYLPNPDEILQRQSKGKNIELYTDEMQDRDSTVYASVQNLQHSFSVLPWKILPTSEKPADVEIATDLRQKLERVNNFQEDLFELGTCAPVGFAVSEILWRVESDGSIGIERLYSIHQRRVNFNAEGQLLIFDQKHAFPGAIMPERKFIVARYGSKGENPYGDPVLKHCYWPYWFKKGGFKFWSVFLERFGQPALDATYKGEAGEPEKKKLEEILEAWQQGTAMTHSDNITLQILEAQKTGTASYDGFIRVMNEEIVKTVLLQAVLTEQTQPGTQMSPATAKVVWQNRITSLAKTVASALNATLIRWLVDFNYGENVLAPTFVFDTEPEEDLTAAVGRVEKLVNLGLPVSKQALYDQFKIRVPKQGEDLLEPQLAKNPFGLSERGRPMFMRDRSGKTVFLKVRVPEPPKRAIGRYDLAAIARGRRKFAEQLDKVFQSLSPGLQNALATNRPVLAAVEDYISSEMPTRLATVLYNGNLESLKTAAESMASRLSVTVNESRFAELATEYARVHAYDLGAAQEMTATIKESLSNWISGQTNLEGIRDDLMEKFAELSESSAERIAVTETQKAANWAATEMAKESGLDLEAWFVGDSTDEPICLDLMAGNPYPLNGSEVGDIPHPNCQHRWIFAKKAVE